MGKTEESDSKKKVDLCMEEVDHTVLFILCLFMTRQQFIHNELMLKNVTMWKRSKTTCQKRAMYEKLIHFLAVGNSCEKPMFVTTTKAKFHTFSTENWNAYEEYLTTRDQTSEQKFSDNKYLFNTEHEMSYKFWKKKWCRGF